MKKENRKKQKQKQNKQTKKKNNNIKKMCSFCVIILEHTNLGKRNTVCYNFLLKWKKNTPRFSQFNKWTLRL